ncbi:hypothetical protein ADJ79_03260 [Ottowia sp. oral taxon 894]|nr:hypothetical protein ADJ79_03260 [Ottowia sp. oral taxon 894]
MLPVPRGFFMPWRKALEMHNPPAPPAPPGCQRQRRPTPFPPLKSAPFSDATSFARPGHRPPAP